MGYEFQYPDDWKYNPSVFSNDANTLWSELSTDNNMSNFIDYIDHYTVRSTAGLGDYDPQEPQKTKIIVGNVEAVKLTFTLNKPKIVEPNLNFNKVIRVFIPLKNNILLFGLNGNDTLTFDHILSTFKFISLNPSPNISAWKTYKNIQHGFELKYPDTYAIKTKLPQEGIVTFTLNNEDKLMIVGQVPYGVYDPIVSEKDIIIGGKKGQLIIFDSNNGFPIKRAFAVVDLDNSENTTRWSMFIVLDKDKEAEDIATFEKILSTIKFIN